MNDLEPTPDPADLSSLPLFQSQAPVLPDSRARDHLLAATGGRFAARAVAPVSTPVGPQTPAAIPEVHVEYVRPAAAPAPAHSASTPAPNVRAAVSHEDDIDWDIVDVLQRLASEKLIDGNSEIPPPTARAEMSNVDLEHLEQIRRIVDEYVLKNVVGKLGAEFNWSEQKHHGYATAVFNEIYRWGRLQTLLTEEGAKHINIIGHQNVLVRYLDGHYEQKRPIARSDEELMDVLQNLASKKGGRDFSDIKASVGFDLRGARLNMLAPSVAGVPTVGIRIHNYVDVDFKQLIDLGTINGRGAGLLGAAVQSKRNVLISGEPGSGKTTLLRACASTIPYGEVFATIESEYELYLHELKHRHIGVIPIQMREGNSEGIGGEYSLRDGIKDALRQNLQRQIVGEVRGIEVKAMMESMQIGGGTLATIHAESPSDAIFRLANLIIEEGNLTNDYYPMRMIEQHIRLIVQIREIVDREGRPRHVVTEIAEVTPPIGGSTQPLAQTLLRFDPEADELVFTGTQPSDRLREKLEEGGLSPTFFRREGTA